MYAYKYLSSGSPTRDKRMIRNDNKNNTGHFEIDVGRPCSLKRMKGQRVSYGLILIFMYENKKILNEPN